MQTPMIGEIMMDEKRIICTLDNFVNMRVDSYLTPVLFLGYADFRDEEIINIFH